MAEQEKPQGPKRRSSHKAARAAASGRVITNQGAPPRPPRPTRHHVKGASPERGAGGAKPAPSAPSAAETKARGWVADLTRYLKSVKAELLRVTWPTRQELKVATMVVVAMLFVLTMYLFVVDQLFTFVFRGIAG